MQKKSILVLVLIISGLAACSGKKTTEQVYKPGAKNVFRTEGKDEQACFKNARKQCDDGDFEVLKKDMREEGEAQLETLEFRCI